MSQQNDLVRNRKIDYLMTKKIQVNHNFSPKQKIVDANLVMVIILSYLFNIVDSFSLDKQRKCRSIWCNGIESIQVMLKLYLNESLSSLPTLFSPCKFGATTMVILLTSHHLVMCPSPIFIVEDATSRGTWRLYASPSTQRGVFRRPTTPLEFQVLPIHYHLQHCQSQAME